MKKTYNKAVEKFELKIQIHVVYAITFFETRCTQQWLF